MYTVCRIDISLKPLSALLVSDCFGDLIPSIVQPIFSLSRGLIRQTNLNTYMRVCRAQTCLTRSWFYSHLTTVVVVGEIPPLLLLYSPTGMPLTRAFGCGCTVGMCGVDQQAYSE